MLQPRRIAARNAAGRMAELLGELPGDTVGYRMRMDTRVGPQTRIEVVTEGVLLRMLHADPVLSDVGLLIFDEFHERSLDADLGLALALLARETFDEEACFRLLVMSATLDVQELNALLNCPVLLSEGRLHPVQVNYGVAAQPRDRITERVLTQTHDVLQRHADSSVLVFLPGQGEIRRVAEQLQVPEDVRICPLYGDLSMAEQRRAISVSEPGQRKVVLATNIAETSLTIDGVDVVVDSGLERVPVFDPNTGMSRLNTVKISQASAEQRKGRAGRMRPGHCYRLWSQAQQEQLAPQQRPEIQDADLTAMCLQLFALGVHDAAELSWLTPPPLGAFAQAVTLLLDLGALDSSSSGLCLSKKGAAMAALPVHPRLANMLLLGQAAGFANTAALLAAVLSERDPLSRETADMQVRLEYLTGELDCPSMFRAWKQRVSKLAKDLQRKLPAHGFVAMKAPPARQVPAFLLASAYPDRIARQRHGGSYQLANGRSCQFATPSPLEKHRWLAVAELSGASGKRSDVIRSATALDPVLFEGVLADRIRETTQVDWDSKSGHFVAERRRACGSLLLASTKLDDVTEEARVEKLVALVRDSKLTNLNWDRASKLFRARAAMMHEFDERWPAFTDAALLDELEQWLAPFLNTVKSLNALQKVNLIDAMRSRISWEQRSQLDELLPEKITVPSGSAIAIDYALSPPVLAVKLQAMFGCESTPSVAGGRVALMVHLLSPAGRPLQVTQDLGSFWRNGYEAVKKEMRGRYPKHPWPDDPLLAAPTGRSKKRSKR